MSSIRSILTLTMPSSGRELPRRHFLEIALVVVAIIARRFYAKLFVDMAAFAIQLGMRLIQSQADHRMLKRTQLPVLMTGPAFVVQSGDLLAGWMARTAAEPLMESIQRPAGDGMYKGRFLLGAVALGTVVGRVAILTANRVNFLHALA